MTRNEISITICLSVALVQFYTMPSTAAEISHIKAWKTGADVTAVKSIVEPSLEMIPKSIRDLVFNSGCRILVVPTVSDFMKAKYSDKPRGYTDGGGYDNADGLFVPSKNYLLVSEKVSFRNSRPAKSRRIPYVLCHEFGHAFDHFLSSKFQRTNASALPKFLRTHNSESKRLSNTLKRKLAYFCQPGMAGASETFAEFFQMNCNSHTKWKENQKSLALAFPQCHRLVKQAMKSPNSLSNWKQ